MVAMGCTLELKAPIRGFFCLFTLECASINWTSLKYVVLLLLFAWVEPKKHNMIPSVFDFIPDLMCYFKVQDQNTHDTVCKHWTWCNSMMLSLHLIWFNLTCSAICLLYMYKFSITFDFAHVICHTCCNELKVIWCRWRGAWDSLMGLWRRNLGPYLSLSLVSLIFSE